MYCKDPYPAPPPCVVEHTICEWNPLVDGAGSLLTARWSDGFTQRMHVRPHEWVGYGNEAILNILYARREASDLGRPR